MKRASLLSVVGLLLCIGSARGEVNSVPPVIPAPAQWQALEGSFTVTPHTAIAVPHDAKVEWTAHYFADLLARTRSLTLAVKRTTGAPPAHAITFALDAGDRVTSDEGYELRIAAKGIAVSARHPRGLLYGAITLWQLMTADGKRSGTVHLDAIEIHDAPRFAWRGLMLDSARHYQSPKFIEHFLDTMAVHKLNTLHWHLTDDQAWRLEIKKYPRLAEVGGWRVPAGPAAQANIDPKTGKPRKIGGIYTQDTVRHLVAYAAARGITIVPEIEMPGHATAAIVAYPQLASTDHPPTEIPSDWGVYNNLYNVDESTFRFLDNVLTEVVALFPGPFVHVGGDEAVKDQWRASASIQARMRELGIDTEAKLQSYFVRRIEEFLRAHGRRLIGWDEILDGGIAPEATVMSWRGIQGAVTAARAGHDAVLSPAPTLYFDNRQSARQVYPPGRGAVVDIGQVYAFDPLPADLTPDEQKHILGLQGNLWTEHIRTEPRVDYMAWPRGAAIAEIGWSPKERRDWRDFAQRLAAHSRRYQALGVHSADVMFRANVIATLDREKKRVSVLLSNEAGVGEIRYTTNGAAPSLTSKLYATPLDLPLGSRIAATAFDRGEPLTDATRATLDLPFFERRGSHQLNLCTQKIALSLEDDAPIQGKRAVFMIDVMNPCWIDPAVDLTNGATLTAAVGQIPFNFQIGDDVKKIELLPPATPEGELDVFAGGCTGAPIASLPLAPAVSKQGVTVLPPVKLEPRPGGPADLCFRFTQSKIDPMWAIDWVEVHPSQGTK